MNPSVIASVAFAASLFSGGRRVPPPRPHPQQLLGIPLRLHDAGQVRLAVEALSAVLADARDCAGKDT